MRRRGGGKELVEEAKRGKGKMKKMQNGVEEEVKRS